VLPNELFEIRFFDIFNILDFQISFPV